MKTELLKSQVGLWFNYLKLAARLGLNIEWGFYRLWGTPEEIRHAKFGTWWRIKGRSLFERSNETQIRVVSQQKGFIDLRVPSHWTVRQVRKEIGPIFSTVRVKDAPRGKGEFVIKGRYSYADFKKYLRLIESDLKARESGKRDVMGKLIRTFKIEEEKRKEKAKKATATSAANAAKRGKKRHRRFKATETKVTANEQRNGYLWRKRGRRIAENVARGEFPGTNRH